MMTDSAYINPSERERYHFERKTEGKISGLVHKDQANYSVAKLRASHAVVDSIAAEAIDILRMEPTLDHSCDLEGWDESCNECRFVRKARAVVQRFDNLTKGTE